MKSVIRSIYRNPVKNAVYVLLLITAFTPVILQINTYIIGDGIVQRIEEQRYSFADSLGTQVQEYLFELQRLILSSMISLLGNAILFILLCILVLPFLQYLLSLGRGYEIGVLRTLGMGKRRVWMRLQIENLLLMASALVLAICAAIILNKPFAFSLLGIDVSAGKNLLEAFGSDAFVLNPFAILLATIVAAIVTLISSALSNVLLSACKPLKLIRKYK
jgi:hypothetical protein